MQNTLFLMGDLKLHKIKYSLFAVLEITINLFIITYLSLQQAGHTLVRVVSHFLKFPSYLETASFRAHHSKITEKGTVFCS